MTSVTSRTWRATTFRGLSRQRTGLMSCLARQGGERFCACLDQKFLPPRERADNRVEERGVAAERIQQFLIRECPSLRTSRGLAPRILS
ncbi:MAG: hypothetical protein ACR2IK_06075 [Chloroflexota bacterium]